MYCVLFYKKKTESPYQNTPDNVSQVRDIVHIRQGTCNKNVILSGNRKRGFSWGGHIEISLSRCDLKASCFELGIVHNWRGLIVERVLSSPSLRLRKVGVSHCLGPQLGVLDAPPSQPIPSFNLQLITLSFLSEKTDNPRFSNRLALLRSHTLRISQFPFKA